MRNKTRPAGLAAIGFGLLATLLFLAGPAAADPPGTNAEDRSVTSGNATAEDGSVASGDAHAEDGSVSSGCASAEDDSTASGGLCPKKVEPVPDHKKPDHKKPEMKHRPDRGGRGKVHGVGGAGPARAVQSRALAVTGPTTVPLAAAGAVLLGLGIAMVVLTSDRRRSALSVQ